MNSSDEEEGELEIDYKKLINDSDEETQRHTEIDTNLHQMPTPQDIIYGDASFFYFAENQSFRKIPPELFFDTFEHEPRKKLQTAANGGHDIPSKAEIDEKINYLIKKPSKGAPRKKREPANTPKQQINEFPGGDLAFWEKFWNELSFNVNYSYIEQQITIKITPETEVFNGVISDERKNFPKSLGIPFASFLSWNRISLSYPITSLKIWNILLNQQEEGQTAAWVSHFLGCLDELDPKMFMHEKSRVENYERKILYVTIAITLKFARIVLKDIIKILESETKSVQSFTMKTLRESLVEFTLRTDSTEFDQRFVDFSNNKSVDFDESTLDVVRVDKQNEELTHFLQEFSPKLTNREKKMDADPASSHNESECGFYQAQAAGNGLDFDEPDGLEAQSGDILGLTSGSTPHYDNFDQILSNDAAGNISEDANEDKVNAHLFRPAENSKESFSSRNRNEIVEHGQSNAANLIFGFLDFENQLSGTFNHENGGEYGFIPDAV